MNDKQIFISISKLLEGENFNDCVNGLVFSIVGVAEENVRKDCIDEFFEQIKNDSLELYNKLNMKNLIKNMFCVNHKPSNDNKEKYLYINTVDELDQYLHDRTMEVISSLKDQGTIPEKEIVILSDTIYEIGEDNLFEILMMKAMDRALNDPELKINSDRKDVRDIQNNINSLFVDEKATHH